MRRIVQDEISVLPTSDNFSFCKLWIRAVAGRNGIGGRRPTAKSDFTRFSPKWWDTVILEGLPSSRLVGQEWENFNGAIYRLLSVPGDALRRISKSVNVSEEYVF